MKLTLLLIFTLTLSMTILRAETEADKKYDFFRAKTQVKKPFDLRDPFKRNIIRKKNQDSQAKIDSGIYSDEGSIDNVPLEKLKIVGVLLGEQRRAMVRVLDSKTNEIFYLKEGMKVGQNGAELKAILPSGVILVEKIRNVYDQDEYLETVIPISH